ncbi:MAG: hypothetical protein ACKOEL_08655 [Planctomycetota bacterium]
MNACRSSVAALAAAGSLATGCHAALIGISADNYQVVDGARRFSVIDVFADCTGAYDKLVNFYGTSASTSLVRTTMNGTPNGGASSLVSNGAGFAQATGTGWMPSTGGSDVAWDSFVTIGARTQADADGLVAGDSFFTNRDTIGAETVAGGNNSQNAYAGAGWYTSVPTGSHVYAGSYGDLRIMLGRFAVETTNLSVTDVLTLQFKGNVSMKVNGIVAGGGTTVQPSFDQTFTYGFVPAPGALAVLGLAGLGRTRRR